MDIDLNYTVDDGLYERNLGDTYNTITGNRALLNRFQITMFSEGNSYVDNNGNVVTDDFGGRFMSMIGDKNSLTNTQGMIVSMTAVIDNTVKSLKSDELNLPNTEKIDSASIKELQKDGDKISVIIDVTPVEVEYGINNYFYLPIKA